MIDKINCIIELLCLMGVMLIAGFTGSFISLFVSLHKSDHQDIIYSIIAIAVSFVGFLIIIAIFQDI